MLIRHAPWIAMLSPRIAASLVLVVVCSLGYSLPPAAAHEPIDEQIAALEQRIDADPRNAALYLRRGGLESHRGEWQAALADYDRAGAGGVGRPG